MPTKIDVEAKYLKDLEIWQTARSDAALQYLIDAQQPIIDQARALRDEVAVDQPTDFDLAGWDLALENYEQRLALYRTQPEMAEQPLMYGYGIVNGQRIDEPDIQTGAMLFNDMADLAPDDITWADEIRQRALAGLEAHYTDLAQGMATLARLKDPAAAAYEAAGRIALQAADAIEYYTASEMVARARSRAVGTMLGIGLGITAATVLVIAAGSGKLRLPK